MHRVRVRQPTIVRLLSVVAIIFILLLPLVGQQVPTVLPSDTGDIRLEVVVTPRSGPPVSGLEQNDFTVWDNKAQQTITSFRALRGHESPVEVLLVVDDVNTGFSHIAFERSEIDKFLKHRQRQPGLSHSTCGFDRFRDQNPR